MNALEFCENGMPTKPDVDKLVEKFGKPAIGSAISYADIAECISADKHSSRFATVVQAWRKQLIREHNIELLAERGKGFISADGKSRLTHHVGGYKSGLRKLRRTSERAAIIPSDQLDSDGIRARDAMVRNAAAIRSLAMTASREIALPTLQVKKNGS